MNSNRKIAWIIDGEADLCLLLKAYFLRKNYEVRIFHTCMGILKTLQTDIPDYVFMDKNVCDDPDEIIDSIRKANPGVQIHVGSPDA